MKHLIHLFNFLNCFKVLTFFKHHYVSDNVAHFWRESGKENKIVDLKNNYLTLIKRNFRNAKHFKG